MTSRVPLALANDDAEIRTRSPQFRSVLSLGMVSLGDRFVLVPKLSLEGGMQTEIVFNRKDLLH